MQGKSGDRCRYEGRGYRYLGQVQHQSILLIVGTQTVEQAALLGDDRIGPLKDEIEPLGGGCA